MAVLENTTEWRKPWSVFLSEEQKNDEFTCSICLGYFELPIQTQCGHIFCGNCLELHLHESDSKSCPRCRQECEPTSTLDLKELVKKALGLGVPIESPYPEAPDFLQSHEIDIYHEFKRHVQNHVLTSCAYRGPWCFQIPSNVTRNVFLRVRYQLELRGFTIFNVFEIRKPSQQDSRTYCRIIVCKSFFPNEQSDVTLESGWNESFTSVEIERNGEQNLKFEIQKIKNMAHLSSREKCNMALMTMLEMQ